VAFASQLFGNGALCARLAAGRRPHTRVLPTLLNRSVPPSSSRHALPRSLQAEFARLARADLHENGNRLLDAFSHQRITHVGHGAPQRY